MDPFGSWRKAELEYQRGSGPSVPSSVVSSVSESHRGSDAGNKSEDDADLHVVGWNGLRDFGEKTVLFHLPVWPLHTQNFMRQEVMSHLAVCGSAGIEFILLT